MKDPADPAVDPAAVPWSVTTVLRGVVLGYRVVGAVWLAVLGVVAVATGQVPAAVVTTVAGLAGVWAVVTIAVARRGGHLRSWGWLGLDASVAALTVVGPLLLDAGARYSFAGGYPFTTVVLAAWARGQTGALLAAGALSAATLGRTILLDGGAITFATVVDRSAIYVAGGLVLAWSLRVLERSEAERLAAQAALAAERTQRIRSQERAETAVHLHDSVLQSLALIQRRSADPADVTTIARRQERELRAWLAGGDASTATGTTTLAAEVRAVAADIEATHRLAVDVVAVGDAPVDDRIAGLVGATREALVNAAKYAGVERVEVYAEVAGDQISVFVRDRGTGFDATTVAADRHGVRTSIVQRLERHGGTATIRTATGAGTEVAMTLPRAAQVGEPR